MSLPRKAVMAPSGAHMGYKAPSNDNLAHPLGRIAPGSGRTLHMQMENLFPLTLDGCIWLRDARDRWAICQFRNCGTFRTMFEGRTKSELTEFIEGYRPEIRSSRVRKPGKRRFTVTHEAKRLLSLLPQQYCPRTEVLSDKEKPAEVIDFPGKNTILEE